MTSHFMHLDVGDFLLDNATKPRQKKKSCLVFWIDEKKTSIEPLSSVVKEEDRVEGTTCMVRWKGPGRKSYKAKILKISDCQDELTDAMGNVCRQISDVLKPATKATVPKATNITAIPKTAAIRKVTAPKTTNVPSDPNATNQKSKKRAAQTPRLEASKQMCKSIIAKIQERSSGLAILQVPGSDQIEPSTVPASPSSQSPPQSQPPQGRRQPLQVPGSDQIEPSTVPASPSSQSPPQSQPPQGRRQPLQVPRSDQIEPSTVPAPPQSPPQSQPPQGRRQPLQVPGSDQIEPLTVPVPAPPQSQPPQGRRQPLQNNWSGLPQPTPTYASYTYPEYRSEGYYTQLLGGSDIYQAYQECLAENSQLRRELGEVKAELAEKNMQVQEMLDNIPSGSVAGLNVTPRKVLFMKQLVSALEGDSTDAMPRTESSSRETLSQGPRLEVTQKASTSGPQEDKEWQWLQETDSYGNKKIQFQPGVFLTQKQLDAVKSSLTLKETKGLKVVLRNVLLTLFSREELSRSCCQGQRRKGFARDSHSSC